MRERLTQHLTTLLCLALLTLVFGPGLNVVGATPTASSNGPGALSAMLQDEPPQTDESESGEADAGDQEDSADDATEDDEPDEQYFAITGGRVHTVSGPVLEDVTVLCKDGVIEEIGRHVQIPEHAERLNADGYRVYPGLIAADSFGLIGRNPVEDTANVYSLSTTAALAGGITTAVSGSTAGKLKIGTLDGLVVKENLFENLRYTTSNPRGRRRLREAFDRVLEYLRDLEAHERREARGLESEEPDDRWIRGRNERYLKLLTGELTAIANADTAHDILQLCELAEQYGISIVVSGAREGWTVAPEMSRAGMKAIVTPRTRVDPDDRLLRPNGSSIENAAILREHGIPVAIVPARSGVSFGGLAGRDLMHLPMEAAFGVRGGLSNEAAVRSITLDAARVLGIDHRVGSIEVGKDADFIITDGDLLHYMTHVRWTVVDGEIMYDKMDESLFDHIRPDGDPDAPPPDDHWPRRLGEEW